MKLSELKNDQLVAAYVQLRDLRSQRKAAFDNQDAEDKARQEKIEGILLGRFESEGIESCRTGAGTAYKAIKTMANVADWDSALGFIKEEEAWEFLERRISKTAVEQYMEANEGKVPPGINIRRETVINVRRS